MYDLPLCGTEINVKKVYILLSRTNTLPSRMIHSVTGGKFTHTSIAIHPQTDEFYSYARRKLHNILNGGLIVENTHSMIFAKYPDCPCAIYSLSVSDAAYDDIQNQIAYYMKNYKKCKYNFLGCVQTFLKIRSKPRFRFTCSQFVGHLLEHSGAVQLPCDSSIITPNDFIGIPGMKLVYSGTIGNCDFPESEKKDHSAATA